MKTMKHSDQALNAATGLSSKDDNAPSHPTSKHMSELDASPLSAPEDGARHRPSKSVTNSRHSNASEDYSANYDEGNKGYLSKSEKVIREYDTNNDGQLDIRETKKIVRDMGDLSRENRLVKKIAMGGAGALVLSFFGNFALIWAVLVLTRQTESQNGNLVESSTGNHIRTLIAGLEVKLIIPEEMPKSRLLRARGDASFNLQEEVRKLQEAGGHVGVVSDVTRTRAKDEFNQYAGGTSVTTSFVVSGVTYTATADSGASFAPDANACDVYSLIKEIGTTGPFYEFECCNGDDNFCTLHLLGADGERNCFSPMATVVEKSKGKMFLMDLEFGDYVLAANGVFRPFLYHIHSSKSVPTPFLQIHTDSSKDAPLEASSHHFVFLHKKELPIPAGQVKLGDELVGVNGPRTVTKIATVTRDGFVSSLTSDATHFVDGVLASSIAHSPENIAIGALEVHVHSLFNRVLAPLNYAVCKTISGYFCTAQLDDGEGGMYSAVIKAYHRILEMPASVQVFVIPSLLGVVVTCLLSYCIALILFILVPFVFTFGRMFRVKNLKEKMI